MNKFFTATFWSTFFRTIKSEQRNNEKKKEIFKLDERDALLVRVEAGRGHMMEY